MSDGMLWPAIWEAGSWCRAEAIGAEVIWEEAAARRADSWVALVGEGGVWGWERGKGGRIG